MWFEEGHIYHVYNMGNKGDRVFFNRDNYLFFLRKMRKEIKPVANILAYCLMPNHFHFILRATNKSCEQNSQGIQLLSFKIGVLLRSYTRAVNKEQHLRGSLFRQRTKAKDIGMVKRRTSKPYLEVAFAYVFYNPVRAGLVDKPEYWEFSCYRDLLGLRGGTFCDKSLVFSLLNIDEQSLPDFMRVYAGVDDNEIEGIF